MTAEMNRAPRRGTVRLMSAGLLALCIANCIVSQPATAWRGGSPAAVKQRGRSLATWRISSEAVGPIELGMPEAAIRRIAATHELRVHRSREDDLVIWVAKPGKVGSVEVRRPQWSLILSNKGQRLMRVKLSDDDHGFIEVLDPRFATAEGAHVGMRVRELAKLYGQGDIYLNPDKSASSVYFGEEQQAVFGVQFSVGRVEGVKFTPEPPNGVVTSSKAWQKLLRANPRVTDIGVLGE